jgi:hypothetical protein
MNYTVYHYGCQNFNDTGYGCSYRNMQTLISSIGIEPPLITTLLKYFFTNYSHYIDNNQTRRLWIEPCDISIYMKDIHKIDGKNILYMVSDRDIEMMSRGNIIDYIQNNSIYVREQFNTLLDLLSQHFTKYDQHNAIPIIIDNGVYSYCLIGIDSQNIRLCDPHKFNTSDAIYSKQLAFLKEKFWMIYIPTL